MIQFIEKIKSIILNNSYKYVVKEISSDEENSNDSDEEYSDEKILMKEIKYINLFLKKV